LHTSGFRMASGLRELQRNGASRDIPIARLQFGITYYYCIKIYVHN